MRPLWVKVKNELALPLLADAAAQGLCSPPTNLLALDAEALDTVLRLLLVRHSACSFGSLMECPRPWLSTLLMAVV